MEHPSIGIDLLEIERLERALARRPRLADRLFTDGERRYAASRARPGQHLAARFCAKEAVAKALGMAAFSWRDVEVVSDGGAPGVQLHGAAAQRAAKLGVVVRVSLTHTRTDAGAVAVTERGDTPAVAMAERRTADGREP
jgi:holo-[acyl-carrier protein] synthase